MKKYSDLKNDIASFLDRDDLSSKMETFIDLASKRIYRAIRHPQMEMHATATSLNDGDSIQLPLNYLEMMKNGVRVNNKIYDYANWDQFSVDFSYGTFFSRFRDELFFQPELKQGDIVDLYYYQEPERMKNDDDSPVVLDLFYDLYLFGSLCEAKPFLMDDERIAIWEQKFNAAMFTIDSYSKEFNFGNINNKKMKIRI